MCLDVYSNIILQETQAEVKDDNSQQELSEQQLEKDSSKKAHAQTHSNEKISYISVRLEQKMLHILNSLLIAWILGHYNILLVWRGMSLCIVHLSFSRCFPISEPVRGTRGSQRGELQR